MSSQAKQPDFWQRAYQARDKLVDEFIHHPNVSLIDIGRDVDPESGEFLEEIVLRVHVRSPHTAETLGIPAEIDNIPVRVVQADYRLE